MSQALGGNWWVLYGAERQLATVVIPFFAIASGYFFGKRVRVKGDLEDVFESYGLRIIKVFLFWSLVYVLFPDLNGFSLKSWSALVYSRISGMVANPVITLITGGKGVLWFLVSMMVSAYIVKLFGERKREPGLLIFTFILYLFSLLTRTYSFLPTHLGIDIDWFKPAGIVCSMPLFFSIGWYLSSGKFRVSLSASVLATVGGYCLYVLEYYVLSAGFKADMNPLNNIYLASTIVTATGCFMALVSNRDMGRSTVVPSIGKYTLGIYLSHMLFMDLSAPLREKFHSVPVELVCASFVYTAALFLTMACAKNRYLKDFFI